MRSARATSSASERRMAGGGGEERQYMVSRQNTGRSGMEGSKGWARPNTWMKLFLSSSSPSLWAAEGDLRNLQRMYSIRSADTCSAGSSDCPSPEEGCSTAPPLEAPPSDGPKQSSNSIPVTDPLLY